MCNTMAGMAGMADLAYLAYMGLYEFGQKRAYPDPTALNA